ncbi:MAG: hypothetical protein COZ15_06200 [Elusimicrobia bacterium CG_4_10_14_3_um_filter_49_12_50_7]|nr:MAG: hypothetical protein COZ15_06200 [Elusimicrobia bacterium CG_4_10_14_3_um_filter_49_12_50_7]
MKKRVKKEFMDSGTRSRQILLSLVKEFIIHRRPVGSKHLNARYNMGVSPATIRNVLSALEKEGFLSHESHSSGRIPTAKGLQFYIDSILTREEIMNGVKISGFTFAKGGSEEIFMLEQACRMLSVYSTWVGLTCFTDEKADYIDFDIKMIAPGKLLVFIICRNGEIRKTVMRLTKELKPSSLTFIKNYLKKEKSPEKEQGKEQRLYSKNADIINEVRLQIERLSKNRQTRLITSVHPSVLKRGAEVLNGIFSLIEEKQSLLSCIESSLPVNDSGITFCQSRLPDNYGDLTVVISDFNINGKRYVCGVLGSKYMDYMRVLPLVKGTAGEVAKYLTEVQ